MGFYRVNEGGKFITYDSIASEIFGILKDEKHLSSRRQQVMKPWQKQLFEIFLPVPLSLPWGNLVLYWPQRLWKNNSL